MQFFESDRPLQSHEKEMRRKKKKTKQREMIKKRTRTDKTTATTYNSLSEYDYLVTRWILIRIVCSDQTFQYEHAILMHTTIKLDNRETYVFLSHKYIYIANILIQNVIITTCNIVELATLFDLSLQISPNPICYEKYLNASQTS